MDRKMSRQIVMCTYDVIYGPQEGIYIKMALAQTGAVNEPSNGECQC